MTPPLLLASDVDDTLLEVHENLGGDLLVTFYRLLGTGRVYLAMITGNDYVNLQLAVELRFGLVAELQPCLRAVERQIRLGTCLASEGPICEGPEQATIAGLPALDRLASW